MVLVISHRLDPFLMYISTALNIAQIQHTNMNIQIILLLYSSTQGESSIFTVQLEPISPSGSPTRKNVENFGP